MLVNSHSSALRLIEARFNLLSRRDANALPPFDRFDFEKLSFATPPMLPEPIVDKPALIRCAIEHEESVDPDEKRGNNSIKGVDTKR